MSPPRIQSLLTGIDPITSLFYNALKGEIVERLNVDIEEIRSNLREVGNVAGAITEMNGHIHELIIAIQESTRALNKLVERLG